MNKDNYKKIRNIYLCPICKEVINRIANDLVGNSEYFKVDCKEGCYTARYGYVSDSLYYEEYCIYNSDGYTISFYNTKYYDNTLINFSRNKNDYNGLSLRMGRISFVDGKPNLDKLIKKFAKLIIIS